MIRAGTREDVPQIVDMGRVFWKETIYKEDFEPETVSELFNTCIDHGLMSVLEIDEKLEGFACGLKTPLIANSKVFLGTEVAWWVNPDHRQGKNGIGWHICRVQCLKKSKKFINNLVMKKTKLFTAR
jgi:hypothetical protein